MTHIYEVVDGTDGERYYSLGVFLSEAEAMSALDGDEPPANDADPEEVTVEVRSRKLGFNPHEYTVIASRRWIRNYDDTLPDWAAQPIKYINTSIPARIT